MVTINGVENTVAPGRPVAVINGGKFNRYNGIRPHEYDKWRMVWNGNHFAPPEPNSVLYLPGVPGFGDTIFDYSGNGNNGAIEGATWVRLPSGLWVLNFDGDDYVDCGDADIFSFGNGSNDSPFTVLAWVNMTDATSFIISSKWDITNILREWLFYCEATSDKLRLYVADESAAKYPYRTSDAGMTGDEGSFVLFGVTYDGRGGNTAMNGVTLYRNDSIVASTATNVTGYVAMENSATVLKLGATDITFAKGKIFNRLLNTALTAAQIADIYRQGRSWFGV